MAPYPTVTLPIGKGGLDGKSDALSIPLGKFATLKNCDLSTPGKIKKRPGFTGLSMTALPSGTLGSTYTLRRIGARKNELLAFTDDPLNSVFTAYGQSGSQWIQQTGRLLPLHASYQRPAMFDGDCRVQDQASSSAGLSLYAWEDGSGATNYILTDRTGTRAAQHTTLGNCIRPKVVAFGANGEVWLFFIETTTWSLKAWKFVPGSLNPTAFTLVTDVVNATTASVDVAITANNSAMFAYVSTTATTVKVRECLSTGSLGANTFDWNHGGGTATAVGIAVDPGNGNVGIVAANTVTAGIPAIIRSSTLAAVSSGTLGVVNTPNNNVTCAFDSANVMRVLCERTNPTTYLYEVWAGGSLTTASATTAPNGDIWYHTALASKLWRVGNNLGAITCYDSAIQSTYFVRYRASNGWTNIGTLLPANAGGIVVRAGHLPQVEIRNSNSFFFAALKRTVLSTFSDVFTSNGGGSRRQLLGIALDLIPSTAYSAAVLNNTLYIAGARLMTYDGIQAREQGFDTYYENRGLGATSSAAGGALTPGTYYYRIYYESYNAQGERELSTCAAALVATLAAANDTLTLQQVQQLTQYSSYNSTRLVGLAIYRTQVNPTAASPFYRCSSTDPTATGANGYLANSTLSESVSFVDKMSDATLATKELDYQNSGELDNLAAPPSRVIAASGTRLFVAGLENGSEVRASKLTFPGQIAAFNDALSIVLPDDGGDITALAVYDRILFIFKQSKLYAVDASGPDNLGNGSFGEPRLVSGDLGAVDWRSICVTKGGVFFRSYKGVYFVARDGEVQPVGVQVESFFPSGANVLSTCAVVDANQVRFQTDAGYTMVYDYELGVWTQHTDPGSLGQVSFVDSSGSPQLYIANATKVYQRNSGSVTTGADDGTAFEWRVKTGFLPLDGPLNAKRIRSVSVLFDGAGFTTTVNASLKTYVDGSAAVIDSRVWTWVSPSPGFPNPAQLRVQLSRQRCESIQIEIFDTQIGLSTNYMPPLRAIVLEIQPQDRIFRLPATQTL